MLGLLDSISPWWWVALAILLAAVEMLTVTTVLIWSATAAVVTALVLWLVPGLGWAEQLALFASLSIAFTFAGRALVARYGDAGGAPTPLNRRADALIGRDGVVVDFQAQEGRVTVDGVPWPARLAESTATPAPGDRVRVIAADGIVVWVRPVELDPGSP